MKTMNFDQIKRREIGQSLRIAFAILLLILLFYPSGPVAGQTLEEPISQPPSPGEKVGTGNEVGEVETAAAAATALPIFRFPVVPGAVISGYFDHNPTAGRVTFYNGRQNASASYGFNFSCSNPYMHDFVGCEDPVTGESACANNRELWYDGHKGIDYEYSPNWHTGAVCNPALFNGITRKVDAPAAGKVVFAGWDDTRPANGYHIRIKHDLNGNGNYEDDNFRSNFLHFTSTLYVSVNEIVGEGDDLGIGGSTGYSSSPHLHFEVQRSSDNFQSSVWSVDPYGWAGAGTDPWPYQNVRLWRVNFTDQMHLPLIVQNPTGTCSNCGELLHNGGFESGSTDWVEVGVDIIDHRSYPNLPAMPYSGDWLAWLGGRNYASDTLYQDFQVPAGASSAQLSYMLQVGTAEVGGVYDYLYVRLRTTGGSLVRDLGSFNNTFLPANQWTSREITFSDLGAHQGEILRLSFEATTDGSAITSFYLDNVSLKTIP